MVVVVVVLTSHEHARGCPSHLNRTGACPFGWTDQPEPLSLRLSGQVPGLPSSEINQAQGEEKGCDARPPLPRLLRSQEDTTCSIASALEALVPD